MQQNPIDVKAADVAATLAQCVEDMADEHSFLLNSETGEDLAVEVADISNVRADGVLASFNIRLEDGRQYRVLVEELGE